MEIFDSITAWRAKRAEFPARLSLGLVHTMGNLHAGHMALIQRSLDENEKTVATVFINPTQFNQATDFEKYPRTLEADLQMLEQAGVDYCLLPKQSEIYADDYRYQIHENKESLLLEGAHRPGHFTGVLTVVMKVLNLVKPTRSYYGEKDHQQLSLIQGMSDAFFLDVKICGCPTVRESTQFALSSRNNRLSEAGRKKAAQFAKIFHTASSCDEAIAKLNALGIVVEYIEEYQGRRFASIYIEEVRLIDNYSLR